MSSYDFGMVGLGTMGRSLLLNMADHGFSVAGLDTDPVKAQTLKSEGQGKSVEGLTVPGDFVALLRKPRAIMILVPAGGPVDSVIDELTPLLEPDDILIDGGNSYYKDTLRRGLALQGRGLEFLGIGVSGGEAGARHGPSMMAGGTPAAYGRVRTTLEAVAAHYEGEPCVALLGPGPAGHYVKMVHNGIEYGLMQLIAEAYDVMRRGIGMSIPECENTFAQWNEGPLQSFLIEITATVLGRKEGEHFLVDLISDKAKQKGTGKWASQDAMDLGQPIPTIDAAVAARELSGLKQERLQGGQTFASQLGRETLVDLSEALRCAFLITYAQGFAQLHAASADDAFHLDLERVAAVWRAGCIIRSSMLEDIRSALSEEVLGNLLQSASMARTVDAGSASLRRVVGRCAENRLPAPCFSASLAYLDGYRSPILPANLIQAQRDYFGAHGYERIDKPGQFHTSDWEARN